MRIKIKWYFCCKLFIGLDINLIDFQLIEAIWLIFNWLNQFELQSIMVNSIICNKLKQNAILFRIHRVANELKIGLYVAKLRMKHYHLVMCSDSHLFWHKIKFNIEWKSHLTTSLSLSLLKWNGTHGIFQRYFVSIVNRFLPDDNKSRFGVWVLTDRVSLCKISANGARWPSGITRVN